MAVASESTCVCANRFVGRDVCTGGRGGGGELSYDYNVSSAPFRIMHYFEEKKKGGVNYPSHFEVNKMRTKTPKGTE